MSDISVAVDIPRRNFTVPRANRLNAFKEAVKAQHKIDLNDYDVTTAASNFSYPIRSQQDYEQALQKGQVSLVASLQDFAKPRCLACSSQFFSKASFEEHFKNCGPPPAQRAARSQEAYGGTRGAELLVQSSSAAIYSLLSAM